MMRRVQNENVFHMILCDFAWKMYLDYIKLIPNSKEHELCWKCQDILNLCLLLPPNQSLNSYNFSENKINRWSTYVIYVWFWYLNFHRNRQLKKDQTGTKSVNDPSAKHTLLGIFCIISKICAYTSDWIDIFVLAIQLYSNTDNRQSFKRMSI